MNADILVENQLSNRVIGLAIEIHRNLGPGLLESAYEQCFCHELKMHGIRFENQVEIPLVYKGLNLDCVYRADLIVEKKLVLEIKAVASIEPIHEAQLITYLKLTYLKLGLILNFNERYLKDGVKRIIMS